MAFALDPMDSLTSSVGVRNLDLLKKVLHNAKLWLETHAFEPLVVLLDDILDQLVLVDRLLLTNGQFAHEFVGEFAFALTLAVLTEERCVNFQ